MRNKHYKRKSKSQKLGLVAKKRNLPTNSNAGAGGAVGQGTIGDGTTNPPVSRGSHQPLTNFSNLLNLTSNMTILR